MKRAHEYAELDLFSDCGENVQVEKILWDEFPCDDVLTNEISELNFTLRAGGDKTLVDLSRAQLYVKMKIINKDGSDITDTMDKATPTKVSIKATEKVAPINNTLHSIFEDCTVYLNDVEVTSANKLYPFSSYLMDLFDTTSEQKTSYMTSQLWYKNGAFNNTTTNAGYKARGKHFGSEPYGMIGKLHSELFNQERYLLNGVEVKVKMTLAKPKFYLMSNEKKDNVTVPNDSYKIKIIDAKMYVPYVHVNKETMMDIEKNIEKKPAVYHVKHIITKAFPILTSTLEHTIDNVSKGQMPSKIIVGFINAKAKQGELDTTPLFFGGYNMKKIELNVNGMPYSKRALTSDYKQNAYAKTYMNLFESLNYIEDGANTPQINSSEFEYGYALYPFNLNPGCCSDPGIFKKSGDVSIYIEFEEDPRAQNLQMIVMSVYDKCIKIDSDRNFTKDW